MISSNDIKAPAQQAQGNRRRFANLNHLLLLSPAFLVLFIITAVPLIIALYYSFTDYTLSTGTHGFVGLENYLYLFSQPKTLIKFLVTIEFVFLALLTEIPLGMSIALLLNREFRGYKIFRAIILIPMMVPLVIAALMWKTMMAPIEGILNYMLSIVGLPTSAWLGDPKTALLSIVLIDIWTHVPFVTLILLAGLQGLPQEVYEAAKVDGASSLSLFTHITIPLMSPFIVLVTIFRTIDSFKVFDLVFATTEGGPGISTTVLHVAAYKEGFTYGFMNTGLALVFLLALLIGIVVSILIAIWQRANRIMEK